jgi:hypothetical protein
MIDIESHILYALCNATKNSWPFPHFFAENVFPEDFYKEFREYINSEIEFDNSSPYKSRTFAKDFHHKELEFMARPYFMFQIMKIFEKESKSRFGNEKVRLYNDLRLIRDGIGYEIGPHTDARWKVVSLLFYLPEDDSNKEFGTSLYVPKDRNGTCIGGPHYKEDGFDKVHTVEFKPNSCLGFWKTPSSFHGVSTVSRQFNRDVLLFNIYSKTEFDNSHVSAIKD